MRWQWRSPSSPSLRSSLPWRGIGQRQRSPSESPTVCFQEAPRRRLTPAPRPRSPTHAPGCADMFAPVPVEPPVARTSWGGLLFLLHLVSGAVSRTVLHLAGLDLLRRLDPDVDPADPALLAFTGRPPFAAGSWSVTDHDPTENEREEAAALAVALLAGLLLRVVVEPPLTPDELLELVCWRNAVVEADPGWIDVLFPIDEVVVEVRAAGLDLDLGHLPWLGCVVRFRYV